MTRKKLWKQLFAIAVVLIIVGTGSFVVSNWQPDQPVEVLIDKWAQPPSTFVELDGMDVHLRDEGPRDDPLPIVLLHGTGASLHTWDGWVDVLSQERRVIRFDLPGFGLTGPNADGNYGVDRYAEFVVAVLDKLGVDRAVVAGNSLGGNIAWAMAVWYPSRVDKLVLLNATGYDFKPEVVPIGFTLARIPVVRNMIRNVMPRDAVRSSIESVYGDPSRVTPELVDLYFDMSTREGNRTALMQRLTQLEGGAIAHLIKEVSQPTLVLWGRKDRLVPVINAERFDADIAGSELLIWEDLGHVPHEEDPARTVQAVQAFLEAS